MCRTCFVLFLMISCLHCCHSNVAWAYPPGSQPCSSSEYHQFDFWVGDWDAFEVSDLTTSEAHLRVEKILGGCVLKETYDGTNGVEGQSFSIYDHARGVWHQSWVTSRGQ